LKRAAETSGDAPASGAARHGSWFGQSSVIGDEPGLLFFSYRRKQCQIIYPIFSSVTGSANKTPSARALMIIPALSPIRKAFEALGRDLPKASTARPAPKIWAQEGGTVVEYSIFLGGGLGFELIREQG
jgi:hypothetical protein